MPAQPDSTCKATPCQAQPCGAQPCHFDPSLLPAPVVACPHAQPAPQVLWDVKVVCHMPATTELIRSVMLPSIPEVDTYIAVFPNVFGYIHWRVVAIEAYLDLHKAILHTEGADFATTVTTAR